MVAETGLAETILERKKALKAVRFRPVLAETQIRPKMAETAISGTQN